MLKINKSIPQKPGVYCFKNKAGRILYIGKANNLHARLRYYQRAAHHLAVRPLSERNETPKLSALLKEANALSWEVLDSEIEALIREAELIKKYRPKYNILMRDDKQYLYVGFTREEFPKVFVTHRPQEKIRNSNIETRDKFKNPNSKIKTVSNFEFRASNFDYIGPFTDAGALRTVLKLLRRIFPYCTCSHPHKTLCLNARIGRCLGYCCIIAKPETAKLSSRSPRPDQRSVLRVSPYARPADAGHRARFGLKTRCEENLAASYVNNIRSIKQILSGKNKILLVSLTKQMRELSHVRRYEEAAKARNQIQALERVFAHREMLKNDISSERIKAFLQLATLLKIKTPISRIEGYDISNIHGKYAYGSMVVFIDGAPKKDEYRIFKIRNKIQTTPPSHPFSEAPRASARGIFGYSALRSTEPAVASTLLRTRLRRIPAPHSSTALQPWLSAKAGKMRKTTLSPHYEGGIKGGNDPAMIHEVITRRLQHPEWPYPDVMLIDGGKAQLAAARAASHLFSRFPRRTQRARLRVSPFALLASRETMPALGSKPAARTNTILATIIISLAKREEELYLSGNRAPIKLKTTSTSLYHLLTHIRNEAHRFAIKYYRAAHQKVVGSRTSDNY